jgi:cytochrome c oxidase cbb3-type subunit 3/ubiquinol-cytochrome c reductase cytochrome c subunit
MKTTLGNYQWGVFLAALIFLPTGVASAAGTSSVEQDNQATITAQTSTSTQLYARYCALCHGENGEGYAADNANSLANQDFLVSVSNDFLWQSISRGRPGTAMAAHAKRYGGPLDESDIDSLVALIRSWQQQATIDFPVGPVLGDPVSGRSSFNQYCATCHGERGQGVTAISLNNSEFLAMASDAQIRWAILHGRKGTPMIAYDTLLPEDTIDDLVSLIRSWQREVLVRVEEPDLPEIRDVVINAEGPAPQFTLREGRYVPAEQLDAAMRGGARLIILDARPTSDWHIAHIPGAISAPAYDPDSIIMHLPEDDTWIVSYCACPHKYSDQLTDALRSAGYANTAVLDEGVSWWQREGYPVEY